MQVLQEGERLLKQEAALAQLHDERLRQRMGVCGQAQGVRKRLKPLDLQRRLRGFAPLELAPQRLVDVVVQRALLHRNFDSEARAGLAQGKALRLLKIEQRHIRIQQPNRFLHFRLQHLGFHLLYHGVHCFDSQPLTPKIVFFSILTNENIFCTNPVAFLNKVVYNKGSCLIRGKVCG